MSHIESHLHLINKEITSNYNNIPNIGVLNGLAGLALFQALYSKTFNTEYLFSPILEECVKRINDGYTFPTFHEGILGFAWTINYLEDENFIEGNNILIDIDEYIFNWNLQCLNENNYDFLHGAIGCVNYFLERYSKVPNKKKHEINNCLELFLKHLSVIFQKIKLFSKGNNSVKIKLGFENKVFFGQAHGLSSIIFILGRISLVPEFKVKSLALMNDYISFLLKYKKEDNNTLSQFPSWLSSDGIVKYFSALSWCTGDLGIGINLLNISNLHGHNLELNNIAINILKHAAKRTSLEKSLLKTGGLCHGHFGAFKIFSKAYTLTHNEDFNEASQYWLNIGIRDFSINSNSDLTLLNGLAGIGLSLLDIINKNDLKWDRALIIS